MNGYFSLLPWVTFTAKLEVVFVLTFQNAFLRVFILKPNVFMWQSVKVLSVFNTLIETTKIENTSFPIKTALSEANVKTNRMTTI